MLDVLVRIAGSDKVETVRFDTSTVQLLDGDLVVYEPNGKFILGGIARGQWISFEIVEATDGG